VTTGLSAYAITRTHEPDAAGPHGVRLVAHGGLALVVADVAPDAFAGLAGDPEHWRDGRGEEDPLVVLARRHDVVVRAVFERHPVLPLRFGTVLRDEPAAVRLLAERHEEASAWLDRVEGHREWRVRARQPRPDRLDPADGESPDVRRNRLAAATRARRDCLEAASALHAALAGHASADLTHPHQAAVPLLDAAYLVPRGAEAAFRADTERHGALDVAVTGPWPPYSFTERERDGCAVAHAGG
jgi:hypothetical protein